MNRIKEFFIGILLMFFLSACGLPQAAAPTPTEPVGAVAPTKTPIPVPTLTISPEPSPTTAPTDTPIGQIFRDDFSMRFDDSWTMRNEVAGRWAITPEGWLQILGEDPSLLGNDYQTNLLCRPAPTGEYQITVHLFAEPDTSFQQATLYLYQDADNYIAINLGYCGICTVGGRAIFMEYKLAGSWGAYSEKTNKNDVYLRLTSKGNSITGYFAFETDNWLRLGSVGNYIQDANVCLGVSNVDNAGINADLIGRFDFLEITLP